MVSEYGNLPVKKSPLTHTLSHSTPLSDILLINLISSSAERNSTKPGHILGTEYDLKMHVRNLGYTLSYNLLPPKSSLFDHFIT